MFRSLIVFCKFYEMNDSDHSFGPETWMEIESIGGGYGGMGRSSSPYMHVDGRKLVWFLIIIFTNLVKKYVTSSFDNLPVLGGFLPYYILSSPGFLPYYIPLWGMVAGRHSRIFGFLFLFFEHRKQALRNTSIMEGVEAEIVIVGAGIAGLTTSLGLHRLGIRSLVLESSESLRVTGFAIATWTNAWRALDEIGLGDSLRQQHHQLYGIVAASTISGLPTSEISFTTKASRGHHEVRCVRRKVLLEALQKELPSGTIRFSSKVVSIQEEESGGCFKLVHLSNGSVVKAKVLIGCDGVNSVVSKWLGFKKPTFVGRSAIRGFADFKGSHGFEPRFLQFFGKGVRSGFIPCNEDTVFWFFTFTPSTKDKEVEENPAKMKEFVLSNLGKVPDKVKAAVEITELDNIACSPLCFRRPWELFWANTSKGNVCVAGDALHPMTPDIGQGGCAALEDSVVLARCLAEALRKKPSSGTEEGDGKEEYKRIERGLKLFARERKWRGFVLISAAYMVGSVQQSSGVVVNFLRDKVLAAFLAGMLLKMADFDCGKLSIS